MYPLVFPDFWMTSQSQGNPLQRSSRLGTCRMETFALIRWIPIHYSWDSGTKQSSFKPFEYCSSTWVAIQYCQSICLVKLLCFSRSSPPQTQWTYCSKCPNLSRHYSGNNWLSSWILLVTLSMLSQDRDYSAGTFTYFYMMSGGVRGRSLLGSFATLFGWADEV